MLTRPEVDEAEAETEAKRMRPRPKLHFFSQILHFDPISSKQTKFSVDFRRDFNFVNDRFLISPQKHLAPLWI